MLAIGKRLFFESGTLTLLTKRLEPAGSIMRLPGAQDERRVRVKRAATGGRVKAGAATLLASHPESVAFPESYFFNRVIRKSRERLIG